LAEELSTIRMVESKDTIREGVTADTALSMQNSLKSDELQSSPNKGFSIISCYY